jgi:CBS domain-containing membrane protein
MPHPLRHRLRALLPPPHTAGRTERLRASLGALLGIALSAALIAVLGDGHANVFLIAPMGASAILLFCLPASPMAQPWAALGGNIVSALVGAACVRLIPAPLVAAPVAVCLAILAMFALRCLHPPGGAVAATTALGGAAVRDLGYGFALAPVGLDTLMLVLAAVLFNNLTGRRYPHVQHSPLANVQIGTCRQTLWVGSTCTASSRDQCRL